ncbi:hypothetical protein AgCh_033561 [Apium graveolens]
MAAEREVERVAEADAERDAKADAERDAEADAERDAKADTERDEEADKDAEWAAVRLAEWHADMATEREAERAAEWDVESSAEVFEEDIKIYTYSTEVEVAEEGWGVWILLKSFLRTTGTQSDDISSTSSIPSSTGGTSEGSVLLITVHKLNGRNYLHWSQSVMMYVSSRGKDDYLTDEKKEPEKKDPSYKSWRIENNMVMSWIINSMEADIGQTFLFYKTAKEIWDAAKETFSDSENAAEIFEIKSQICNLCQGDLTVTQYFSTLTRYWQQLDMFECIEWDCTKDSLKFQNIIEKERIFTFLAGLNRNLDEVRGRILSMKPLPSIHEVCSEVHQRRKSNRPWCDHYHRVGHTKDAFWKIHGKPTNWKGSRNSEKNCYHVAVEEPVAEDVSSPFTQEQMDILQKLLNKEQSKSSLIGNGSVAQKGTTHHALNATKDYDTSWIVDSGASEHMTGNPTLFHSYQTCFEKHKIKIADESFSHIAGKGKIILPNNMVVVQDMPVS